MDFGIGNMNPTATDYLTQAVLPSLEYSLTQLVDFIMKTRELDKWREAKEEDYHRIRREARKKERKDAGESVSGSEEWEDSENSEEKPEVQPPFDPVAFLSEKLFEFRSKNPVSA
jgi:hypothetical protein